MNIFLPSSITKTVVLAPETPSIQTGTTLIS